MQFDQLKRRHFITLLGGAAVAWPRAAAFEALNGRVDALYIETDAGAMSSARRISSVASVRQQAAIAAINVNWLTHARACLLFSQPRKA